MGFQVIHSREIEKIRQERGANLIDVRPPEAYREYHIPGARNLPYENIDNWMHRISRRRSWIVYCDYGSTSLMAARKLGRMDFEVYTVVGGIEAMKSFYFH